jgi:putative transcriptional regulator
MPKAQIANTIRQLRFEHGEMTQQDLANRVGCTRQTIIVLEKERYVPSLSLAFRIARVFDRPIEDIFDLVEEP